MTDFDLPGGESTSAVLRRVEAERDDAIRDRDDLLARLAKEPTGRPTRHLDAVKAERDRLCDELATARTAYLAQAAELVSARTELDAVRTARDNLDRELASPARNGWIVARDGGRDCLRCDQEIRRGEAYEYMPTTDQLQHIHCPDKQGAPTA